MMKKAILLILAISCLIVSVVTLIPVFGADAPTLETFHVQATNGTGAKTYQFYKSDGKTEISYDEGAEVPVNYWYWVSTPGFGVVYDTTGDGSTGYFYFDERYPGGILMTPVGNGDYFVSNVRVKSNYSKDLLTKSLSSGNFIPQPELTRWENSDALGYDVAVQPEWALSSMGRKYTYYNPNGNANYMFKWGSTAGSSLLYMYDDSEYRKAVGGHIDYWSSLSISERQAKMATMVFDSTHINSGDQQHGYVKVTYEGNYAYFTCAIRFSSAQLRQCRDNPNKEIIFTDVQVFYSYNDVSLPDMPDSGSGGGGGGSSEPETETTTVDSILANPDPVSEDCQITVNSDSAVVNYKRTNNGSVSAKVTGYYSGAGKKVAYGVNHTVGLAVFNGETGFFKADEDNMKNDVEDDIYHHGTNVEGSSTDKWMITDNSNYYTIVSSGGGTYGDKAPSTYYAGFKGDFSGNTNWMYTNTDGSYGFQLVGMSSMKVHIKCDYDGSNYHAIVWNNSNNGWDMESGSANSKTGYSKHNHLNVGSQDEHTPESSNSYTDNGVDTDVTAHNREEVTVKAENVAPEIVVTAPKDTYQGVTTHIKVTYTDFEDDIELSEFNLKDPNGATVLKFQEGATQTLQSTLELSNTTTSTSLFETDVVFETSGTYTYTATITDLASGKVYKLDGDTSADKANISLIKYTKSVKGSIVVNVVNIPTAYFGLADTMEVGKAYPTLEDCWDADNTTSTNDIQAYYWELCDANGKKLENVSEYFTNFAKFTYGGTTNTGSSTNPISFDTGGKYANGKYTNGKYALNSTYGTNKDSKDFDVYVQPNNNAKGKKFKLVLYVTDSNNYESNKYIREFTVSTGTVNDNGYQLVIKGNDLRENRAFYGILERTQSTGTAIANTSSVAWTISSTSGSGTATVVTGSDAQYTKNGAAYQGFQAQKAGTYRITATYNGNSYSTDVTIEEDMNPSAVVNISGIVDSSNKEVDSLVAGDKTWYTVTGTVGVSSPDGDLVSGTASTNQQSIFGVGSTYDGTNGQIASASVVTKKIQYTSNAYATAGSGVKVYEVFADKGNPITFSSILTPVSPSKSSTGNAPKYTEQRNNSSSTLAVFNYKPVVNIKYKTSDQSWTGSQTEFGTTVKDNSTKSGTTSYTEYVLNANYELQEVTKTVDLYKLNKLPDDIGELALRLESEDGTSSVLDILTMRCYSDENGVNMTFGIEDEKTSTVKTQATVYYLTGLGGSWQVYNGSDYTLNISNSALKFNCATAGIYKIVVTAIDEKGAMSDPVEAYVRVYDPPTAILSTNPDLVYNTNNEWNTKEIIRFDITSGKSGVDETFGDRWHSMNFSKDCWTIEPLDGQSVEDDILIMEMSKLSGNSVIEPQNLQSENSIKRENGKLTATNLPLGAGFRQFTFLKKGRYKIVYWGYDSAGKATGNKAEQVIYVDEDLPPMIEGTLPALNYRTITTNEDNTKTVTGTNLILSGGTWTDAKGSNVLGFSNGATRIMSPDGDKIYTVSVKEQYDSSNDDTYAETKGTIKLGPDSGLTDDGSITFAGEDVSTFGSYRYLKANNLVLYDTTKATTDDKGKFTEYKNGFFSVRQYFNTVQDEQSKVYLKVVDSNVTRIGKYKFTIEAVELPTYPVIKYISDNKDKFYNRVNQEFIGELDNLAPSASYTVTEKPKVDVIVINNNTTSVSLDNIKTYGNNLNSKLIAKNLDTVTTIYNTNNIKATYNETSDTMLLMNDKSKLAWDYVDNSILKPYTEDVIRVQPGYITFPSLYRDLSGKLHTNVVDGGNIYGASYFNPGKRSVYECVAETGKKEYSKIYNRIDKSLLNEFMTRIDNQYSDSDSMPLLELMYFNRAHIPMSSSMFSRNNTNYYTGSNSAKGIEYGLELNNGLYSNKCVSSGDFIQPVVHNQTYYSSSGATINGKGTETGILQIRHIYEGLPPRYVNGSDVYLVRDSIYNYDIDGEKFKYMYPNTAHTWVSMDERLAEMSDIQIESKIALFGSNVVNNAQSTLSSRYKVVKVYGYATHELLGYGIQYQGTVGGNSKPIMGEYIFSAVGDTYDNSKSNIFSSSRSVDVYCNEKGYTARSIKEYLDGCSITTTSTSAADKDTAVTGTGSYPFRVFYVDGDTSTKRYGNFADSKIDTVQSYNTGYALYSTEQKAKDALMMSNTNVSTWGNSVANYIFKATFNNADNIYVLPNKYASDEKKDDEEDGNELRKSHDSARIFGSIYWDGNSSPRGYYVKGVDGNGNSKKIYYGDGDEQFTWMVSKMKFSDYLSKYRTLSNSNKDRVYQYAKDGYCNTFIKMTSGGGGFSEGLAITGNGIKRENPSNIFKGIYTSNDELNGNVIDRANFPRFSQDTSFYMYSIGSHFVEDSGDAYISTTYKDSTMTIFNPGETYKEALLKFENGYFTVLDMKNLESDIDKQDYQDIKIAVIGNKIKVTRNNKVIFNVTDNNLLTGSRLAMDFCSKKLSDRMYGGFMYGDFQVIDGAVTPLEDVISSHQWRDGADRYVVLAQETSYPGIDATSENEDKDTAEAGILSSGANFIGLSGASSKTWLESISTKVQNNSLAGTRYDLSSDIGTSNYTASFISNLYSNPQMKSWLLVDTELLWNTTYEDPENDPALRDNTAFKNAVSNGTALSTDAVRWRFTHYPEVLANSTPYTYGSSSTFGYSGQWIAESPKQFNQTGTYTVNYKVKDNPFGDYSTTNTFNGYMYFSKNYDVMSSS